MNAHLNFAKLGVVVEEYAENIYGVSYESAARGQPDRSIRRRLVDSEAARRAPPGRAGRARFRETSIAGVRPAMTLRDHSIADAGLVNRAVSAGEWLECGDVDLTLDAPRLAVEIPTGFTDMLSTRSERRARVAHVDPRRSSPPISVAATARSNSSSTAHRARARTCWSAIEAWRTYDSRNRCRIAADFCRFRTPSVEIVLIAPEGGHRIDAHRASRGNDPGDDSQAHRGHDDACQRGRDRWRGCRTAGPRSDGSPASEAPTPIGGADAGQRHGAAQHARRTPMPRLAPSARRTPISGIRWLTAYQIDP